MKIPVIGNGDIISPQGAGMAFERYGVDGIMIGRGAVGHPWIFKEIRHYLDTGDLCPTYPSLKKYRWPKSSWPNQSNGKVYRLAFMKCADISVITSKDYLILRRSGSNWSPALIPPR
jgi:tRNA-dihydrouridine synthase